MQRGWGFGKGASPPSFEPGSPAFLSSQKAQTFLSGPRKAGILDRTRLREPAPAGISNPFESPIIREAEKLKKLWNSLSEDQKETKIRALINAYENYLEIVYLNIRNLTETAERIRNTIANLRLILEGKDFESFEKFFLLRP